MKKFILFSLGLVTISFYGCSSERKEVKSLKEAPFVETMKNDSVPDEEIESTLLYPVESYFLTIIDSIGEMHKQVNSKEDIQFFFKEFDLFPTFDTKIFLDYIDSSEVRVVNPFNTGGVFKLYYTLEDSIAKFKKEREVSMELLERFPCIVNCDSVLQFYKIKFPHTLGRIELMKRKNNDFAKVGDIGMQMKDRFDDIRISHFGKYLVFKNISTQETNFSVYNIENGEWGFYEIPKVYYDFIGMFENQEIGKIFVFNTAQYEFILTDDRFNILGKKRIIFDTSEIPDSSYDNSYYFSQKDNAFFVSFFSYRYFKMKIIKYNIDL